MRRYNPELCLEAEVLYKQGKYKECLQVSLDAHEKAKLDAQEEWQELIKKPPSVLASQTKMWDTTSQRYLNYEEYIKSHNWEDDIPPAAMRMVEKARKQLGK